MRVPVTLGSVAAFSSSITWAFASVRYSTASRAIGPMRVNLMRAFVALPVYGAIAIVHKDAGPSSSALTWLGLSVLCSYGGADALFFSAANRIGASTALAIASTYPLWAALAGSLWRGESFGPQRAIGTMLCIVGVIALVRLTAPPSESPANRRDVRGIAMALLTSLFWAGNSVFVKLGATGLGIAQVNAFRYACALVWLAIVVKAQSGSLALPGRRLWLILVPAIVADALVGSSCYVYGLTHTDLAVGATLSSLAPLISVPFALLFGEERWSARRVCAIATTVLGVLLLVSSS